MYCVCISDHSNTLLKKIIGAVFTISLTFSLKFFISVDDEKFIQTLMNINNGAPLIFFEQYMNRVLIVFFFFFSGNQCYLDIAICEASRNHDYVALAHNGSCGPLDRTDVHCDTLCDEEGQREYCGNDGKTYGLSVIEFDKY